jgi:hypothetical protein
MAMVCVPCRHAVLSRVAVVVYGELSLSEFTLPINDLRLMTSLPYLFNIFAGQDPKQTFAIRLLSLITSQDRTAQVTRIVNPNLTHQTVKTDPRDTHGSPR